VVDGRLTKRAPEPLQREGIPLIGLGPGFTAGREADLVVETHRGERVGLVIHHGTAAAATGVPGPVGGETLRRVLRAPGPGRLLAGKRLGDQVVVGEEIGVVGERPLLATLDGCLRGLIHPSVELYAGMKVGDIDPRGRDVDPALVSDKALAIGGGVLEALLSLRIRP
jgi:xanthine dehydrogenase accessory factor